MADRAQSANDRVSEKQNQQGKLNVTSAGLNPCCQQFNDDYRDMLKSQLGKFSGQEMKAEMLDAVEDRLNKNGFKMEDIAGDPENFSSAIGHAFKQAKDDIEEVERSRTNS